MINFKNFYFVMFAVLLSNCRSEDNEDHYNVAVKYMQSLGYNDVKIVCDKREINICTVRIKENSKEKLIEIHCYKENCYIEKSFFDCKNTKGEQ